MTKQKFRREREYPIDLADWNLPKLEKKLGSIETLVKKTLSEVLQVSIDEGAEIYFNVLFEEDFETDKDLLETPDVDRMIIYLPFGSDLEPTSWSINLVEEIKHIIKRSKDFNSYDDDRINEEKIRLKVLSGVFKICAQMLDDSVNEKWDQK
jgi:hypothetical protein